MYGQLYLFPELAPQEKTTKTKGRKKTSEQPAPPKFLTVDDFIKLPNYGFRDNEKPAEISRDICPEAPMEYMYPFIRRYAPIHMKAFADHKSRLENLRQLLAEEFVRLHAASEKAHPDWFKDGAPVDPEKTSFVPFGFCHVDNDSDTGTLTEHVYCTEFGHAIPLSICGDLVKSLDLHFPTHNIYPIRRGSKPILSDFYQPNMNVADLVPGARMKHAELQDGRSFLILYTGDESQIRSTPNRHGDVYNLSSRLPDNMPEPFGTLSKIYARASMLLSGRTRSCIYSTSSMFFRIYALDDEEREKEKEELQMAVKIGMESWNGFVSGNMESLAGQAKRNLEIDEQKLMELIRSGDKKEKNKCI